MKALRFKVTGSVGFPFDMLRYDGCYPATERDSATIQSSLHGEPGPFTVELETRNPAVFQRGPNKERWRSFLWHVVEGLYAP